MNFNTDEIKFIVTSSKTKIIGDKIVPASNYLIFKK